MSTAHFPDGHIEEVHNATLKEIFERTEDAFDRGAESVTIVARREAAAEKVKQLQKQIEELEGK